MTKEQKILLLFVLAIVGAGGVYYVVQPKVVVQEVTTSSIPTESSAQTTKEVAQEQGTPPKTKEQVAAPVVTGTSPSQPVTIPQAVVTRSIEEKLAYGVPDGSQENITVTAILDESGSIIDVKFAYVPATNKQSREYLAKFASSFTANLVVGKKIGDAKVSRVGGASLTTNAFNKALSNIAAKA